MSNAIHDYHQNAGLRRFDEDFRAESLPEKPDVSAVPDGKYHVLVEHVTLAESATNGNPRLYWTLRITGKDCQGRIIGKTNSITNNSLRYVKEELHLCGLDPDPFSDLPQLLDRLEGIELEITKRTRGNYENIYFERRLDHPHET